MTKMLKEWILSMWDALESVKYYTVFLSSCLVLLLKCLLSSSYFGGGNNNFPHIFHIAGLPYTMAKQKWWILNYFGPAQHLRFLFPLAQVTSRIRFVFPLCLEIKVIFRNRTPHSDVSVLIFGGSNFAPSEVYLDAEALNWSLKHTPVLQQLLK